MPVSTLNSLKGCRRSTGVAVQGSVSTEADGKRPCSVTGNALSASLQWTGPLVVVNSAVLGEAFHDHFVPSC